MPAANPLPESTPGLAVQGGVATITLNRPSQRNSLHDEDLHCLLGYFTQLNADAAVRVVVLTAETAGQAKPVFSAGYHVGGFERSGHDPRLFEKIPDALERLRPLTLCALNGSVYGGATDLLLACDLRIGLAGSEFRMPAVALGLHYYPSGLGRYVSRLGLNMAKRAFLSAQAIPCGQLQAVGLFEQLVGAAEFDAVVNNWVHRLSNLAPLAAQATKQSLNEIAAGRFDEPSLRAREDLTAQSRDFAEGRAAFHERRGPKFEGR
jgi:enoyl-CoA hydratase/carnithine racemase